MRGLTVAAVGAQEPAAELYDELLPYADHVAGASTNAFALSPVAQGARPGSRWLWTVRTTRVGTPSRPGRWRCAAARRRGSARPSRPSPRWPTRGLSRENAGA